MSYTPRSQRRKGNASRNGSVGPEKKRAFRAAKAKSDAWIHQPASVLEKPSVYKNYVVYKGLADRNALRSGTK